MSQSLHPLTFPLHGSRLIEASAGTGKTWTIAALYVRLVLGHGTAPADEAHNGHTGFSQPLTPPEILVMTFTRAATRELSDRIRSRLLEATRCFRGESKPDSTDDFLCGLLADYGDPSHRKQAAWRLAAAADGMDDSAVFTIDAWCQRMLREHAFDTGSIFDETLVADENAILTTAVQDYWRQEFYPLEGEALEKVLSIWSSVNDLLKGIRDLQHQQLPATDKVQDLLTTMTLAAQQRQTTLQTLRDVWLPRTEAMSEWLGQQFPAAANGWNGSQLQQGRINGWLNSLRAWANGQDTAEIPPLTPTAWQRLTAIGLQQARLAHAAPIDIPEVFSQFATLHEALDRIPSVNAAARWHAAAQIQERMRQIKRQASEFGFTDLLVRLYNALQSSSGARLRERILAQYPVALIDEFQDTSPLQYALFDQIYDVASNATNHALLLIGDPKQSIYGFRGADIYSYLQARSSTHGRHYVLGTNYRSTKALVTAVNHLFGQAETDTNRHPEGAFLFRTPGAAQDDDDGNRLPFVNVDAAGRSEHFVVKNQAAPALTIAHNLALQSSNDIRKGLAAECAEQVVAWLNDAQTGFKDKDGHLIRLRPADIAILVRTGKEAVAVRRALQRRRVASVYLSDRESVFQSAQARDLLHWLRGVATPQDAALVRAAFATATIGMTLQELAWLASNDEAFDAYSEAMRALHQVWANQGILAMLRQSLHRFSLPERWLALADYSGERRLTNVLHLAELLQTTSATLEGKQALIRWMELKISETTLQSDEQVVRLESDAELVNVITIHKSKGLEYPLVLLPFATNFRAITKQYTSAVTVPNAEGRPELVLDLPDAVIAAADRERLREDLRLLYVALTRARHALWLGFAAINVGRGQRCKTHQSAAGHLIGGAQELTAQDWLPLLEQLASQQPHTVELRAARPSHQTVPVTPLYSLPVGHTLATMAEYAAVFDRDWTVSSYSRLTRSIHQPTAPRAPSAAPRRAEDESTEAAVFVPTDTVSLPIQHRFKPGALSGNFLHDQLEWLAGARFALDEDHTRLQKVLQMRCERAGYHTEAPEIIQWLQQVVQTTLPHLGTSLVNLGSLIPEMEFWLRANALNTQSIDALCSEQIFPGRGRGKLQASQLHGMLMGFVDLVFEQGGRYWVMDYKSSRLGLQDQDYSLDALQHEMLLRRYDVQALIYQFALHRLLQKRLGAAYDPEQHLGGAIYLFVRGINGPAQGVCWVAPSGACMHTLEKILEMV